MLFPWSHPVRVATTRPTPLRPLKAQVTKYNIFDFPYHGLLDYPKLKLHILFRKKSIIIQKYTRGYLARKQVKPIQKIFNKLKLKYRIKSIIIQKYTRGYLARKYLKSSMNFNYNDYNYILSDEDQWNMFVKPIQIVKQILKTKSIIIQKHTRGYLTRKYVKNYIDFIKRAEEIVKEEQELKDLIKKYEEEVNRQNQEEFNKIFLQNLMATHTIPRHPEKDLLDTLSPKPSGSANTSPNNRNDADVKLIRGAAAGTLAAVVATKIGAIGVGVALAPFTGGWSLTLSYAF